MDIILVAVGIVGATPNVARSAEVVEIATACDSLRTVDFTGIVDAPTQVTATRIANAAADVPAHCVIEGYVAPNVGFRLRLPAPTDWNGKFSQMAPGGYAGSLDVMTAWCDDALRRGYACITQNTGHTGVGFDAVWAFNNLQAEFDYGIRAANVATLAGKAITERFYSARPKFSYFMGCSGGGKQALVQAQRFPWNYDGVIAVEPSNPTVTGVVQLWNALAMHDADGKPVFTANDLQVLHDGAVTRCDALDGVLDRVIGADPRLCAFDPGALTCGLGQTAGCLSAVQVVAARKVYTGPVTSDGHKLYFPALPGGEKGPYFTGGRTGLQYKTMWWQYLALTPDPGPNWKATDFDFDKDWRRAYMKDALLVGSDNPDLRKLRAEGNKLMIIQGWEDSGLPGPLVTLDYYDLVEKLMGGRSATQEFVRLFMIPGRSHCAEGAGAAAIDALGAMETWVEQGRPPDMLVGAHVEVAGPYNPYRGGFLSLPKDPSKALFTRPHYPYPLQAHYTGTGDPNDYRNFEPTEPRSK